MSMIVHPSASLMNSGVPPTALNARTGELKWVYSMNEGIRAAAYAPRQLSGRGVSYWTDGNGDESREESPRLTVGGVGVARRASSQSFP